MIKKIFKHLSILIVIIGGILASRTLLFQKGYFIMHDDLQMMRQLSMEKCFVDFQIPCRWIPDMGYGYGFPLFNFYPPLPYFVGQVFRFIGFTFIDTVKVVFALSIILSGMTMYFLGKEIFKNKWAGVLSSVFYIWAPYHAVDVYVRGAMNESWALVFFPLIFLFGYKLISNDKENVVRNIILLGLSYAGLFLSHNLMVIIFTPFFVVWAIMWLWIYKKKNWIIDIRNLFYSGLLSLGLSAFFTLPAVFENNFTWLKSQLVGYYDYTAHFVTIKQLLITRFWGYGPSIWMDGDGMPFQVGHIHWVLSILISIWLLVFVVRKISLDLRLKIIAVFLLIMGWLSAFMTHIRSIPIYKLLPFLSMIQFPWRFLTLVTFAFSLLAGVFVLLSERVNKKRYILPIVLVIVSVISFNWDYFLPQGGKMGDLTDKQKFSAAAWDLQQTAGIYDYLPLTAKQAPKAPQKVLAEIMDLNVYEAMKDQSPLSDMQEGTNWAKFKTNAIQDKTSIRINIFDFPGWRVYLDGKIMPKYIPEGEEWGRMWIDIPKGEHIVELRFTNTPIRLFSNVLSVITWLGLTSYLVYNLRRGRRRTHSRKH